MGPDPSRPPQGRLLLHEGRLAHLQETEVRPNREHRFRRRSVRQLWAGELLRRQDGFGRVHQDPRHRGRQVRDQGYCHCTGDLVSFMVSFGSWS